MAGPGVRCMGLFSKNGPTDPVHRPAAPTGPPMPRSLTPHDQTRERRRLSPWVTLIEDRVRRTGAGPVETWHAFEQPDYVTVLGLTADGLVPLVRQYRAAIGMVSLELPGGLAEPGEAPAVTALRELEEETGWTTAAPLVALGTVAADTGRLANRLHGFLATGLERVDGWAPEPGVEAFAVAVDEFRRLMLEDHALNGLHLGLVGLALMRGPGPLDRLLGR